jgi:uncharacterized protein (TIGR02246 family)
MSVEEDWPMNNKFRSAVLLVLGILLVFVIVDPIAAQSRNTKLNSAVRKANAEWAAAMKTGDAAVIAAPYADHAVFVGIDGSCIQGRDAIEKMYRERFAQAGVASSTRIDSKHLIVDGDLAYESGYGEMGVTKAGKLTVKGGRYLTIWQRQADGKWKIIRNVVLP